jgi:hypothetical protein
VAGCCECGDEPLGSCATELVSYINYELGKMWKKAAVAQFEILSRHLSGRTKENHKKPQSGYPVSMPRFETGTSRIRRGDHDVRYNHEFI